MIVNTKGQRVAGYEAAYCAVTGKPTAARRIPGGLHKCVGCGATVRLVVTDTGRRAA